MGDNRQTYARRTHVALLTLALVLAAPQGGAGQLKGLYIPGFTGLDNGTQPPPGWSVFVPVYRYHAGELVNDQGEPILTSLDINAFFTGLGVSWVTDFRVLGANYGVTALPIALMRERLEGNFVDVSGDLAFTDIEIQPLQLGWHSTWADFLAGLSLFLPTGKWQLGGDDNSGLGMYSYLFQAGTTLHLDEQDRWSFSTLASYETHSTKRDTNLTVGDVLTLEGGLGWRYLKVELVGQTPVPELIVNVGPVYYGQFKVTEDSGPLLSTVLQGRKDRVWGLGGEVNAVFGTHWALVLRGASEFAARNRTQGWMALVNLAYAF